MIIEKIIFNVLALSLFIIIFSKLIKKNDTIYINVLVLQFLGIGLSFLDLVFVLKMNMFFKILMYILSVLIPIIVIIIEKEKMSLSELINLSKSKIYLLFGKKDEAKKCLLELIDKYPQSHVAHKLLGEIYEKDNKISTAIEEYIRAIEIDTKDYISYFKIAFLLQKIDKNEQAISMLNELLKKKPDYCEASELLGDILYNQEQFKEAITVYTEALRYNPTKYELYYGLGMVYTRLNDFQKAKEYYEKASELNSLLFAGKLYIGQIEMILGDLDEAEKYFMQCLQNDDVEVGAYYYLAQIALLKGEKEKAINYINIAIELDEKVHKKVEEQEIFAPIRKQIKIPNIRSVKISKLSKKEIATQEHLENTYNLVGNLNNNDLKMMKNIKKYEKDKIREEKTRE